MGLCSLCRGLGFAVAKVLRLAQGADGRIYF